MAQRQGLLSGVDLSPVQITALRFLDSLEERDRIRQGVGQFGWDRFVTLFPEYRPEGEQEQAERVDLEDEEGLEATLESTAGSVRYEAAKEPISEEEFSQLMASVASGSFSGDDVEEGDWV